MITIYLDMDGVLADWVKRVMEDPIMSWCEGNVELLNKDHNRSFYINKVYENDPDIFAGLELIPESHHILKYLEGLDKNKYSLKIATHTVCPSFILNHFKVMKDKLKWFDENIKNSYDLGITFDDFHVFTGKGEDHKKYLANYSSVLIDDYDKNIEGFIDNGGKGVLVDSIRYCGRDVVERLKGKLAELEADLSTKHLDIR